MGTRAIKSSRVSPSRGLLAATALNVLASTALADDTDLLDDAFFLSLGLFAQESDFTVELNGDVQSGDRVDLGRTFDENEDQRFRVDGFWRIAERHKVRFMWFNANVNITENIDSELNWGDVTFPVDATVTMDRSFDIYEVAYEYAFLRGENYELAGTVGLHWASFDIELSAELNSIEGEPFEVGDTASANAPLPVFGLHGVWHISGNFWLDAGLQVFTLSYDDYDGDLVDFKAAGIWQPRPWLGLGIGYTWDRLDVEVDANRFDGAMEWRYSGPQVFFSASF